MKRLDYVARWHLSPDGSSDTRDLVVTIPIKLVSESNMREHHMAKHRRRKRHRKTVGLVVRSLLLAEGLRVPVHVTVTRIAPRALDPDNLVGSFKGTIDGIADALGVDDRDARVTWEYGQRRGDAKQYAVAITVAQRSTGLDKATA